MAVTLTSMGSPSTSATRREWKRSTGGVRRTTRGICYGAPNKGAWCRSLVLRTWSTRIWIAFRRMTWTLPRETPRP